MIAGYGTDHHGEGRCKYHGGVTAAVLPQMRSGQGAKSLQMKMKKAYQQKAQEYDLEGDPIDLRAELAVMRDLFYLYIERNNQNLQLGLDVYEYETDTELLNEIKEKPLDEDVRQFIMDVYALGEGIKKMSDAISTHRKDALMSMAEIQRQAARLQEALRLTLEEYIPDEQVRDEALQRFISRSGTRQLNDGQ